MWDYPKGTSTGFGLRVSGYGIRASTLKGQVRATGYGNTLKGISTGYPEGHEYEMRATGYGIRDTLKGTSTRCGLRRPMMPTYLVIALVLHYSVIASVFLRSNPRPLPIQHDQGCCEVTHRGIGLPGLIAPTFGAALAMTKMGESIYAMTV